MVQFFASPYSSEQLDNFDFECCSTPHTGCLPLTLANLSTVDLFQFWGSECCCPRDREGKFSSFLSNLTRCWQQSQTGTWRVLVLRHQRKKNRSFLFESSCSWTRFNRFNAHKSQIFMIRVSIELRDKIFLLFYNVVIRKPRNWKISPVWSENFRKRPWIYLHKNTSAALRTTHQVLWWKKIRCSDYRVKVKKIFCYSMLLLNREQ